MLIVVALTSCDSYNKVYKTNDYDYRYETAKAYYLEGKYTQAAELLESMVTMLKGGDKAEESLILIARCYYESKDYETASQYFKVHYSNYPRGEYAEYARFYSGKSLFMDTPEPELDQTNTYAAINELQLFMEYYPGSKYTAEAQEMLFAMHDILVEKDYLSAKLYYELGSFDLMRNNYQACIVTAQNALKEYPYTKLREELSILILRAKYKMAEKSVEDKKVDRYRDAVDEYYAFKNEFPESKYLEEVEAKRAAMAKAEEVIPEPEHEAEIPIESFFSVELRVGEILSCEPVPKAKKLLKLMIDLGYEKRQVVSGIAKFYKPEDLIGKKVIVVANLKPAKLCGVDSYGMLLASGEEEVKVVFLDKSAKNGDRVR